MRRDEAFVARSLVQFLGGPQVVTASDGADPPDIHLAFADCRVGVEVTRLSQFTLEPDGSLGNRTTQDFFGLRLIDELDRNIGCTLPDGISLLIGLWVPVSNGVRFRRSLTDWVTKIAAAPVKDTKYEQEIEGARTSISVIHERPTGKKITGFVVNKNSSSDIGLNARLVLADRIRTKSEICASLPRPIWLALLNDYWLADADSYAAVCSQLKLAHCFEKLFLVSDDGMVNELVVGA